jgi:hypothetical protein
MLEDPLAGQLAGMRAVTLRSIMGPLPTPHALVR